MSFPSDPAATYVRRSFKAIVTAEGDEPRQVIVAIRAVRSIEILRARPRVPVRLTPSD